MRSTVTVDPLSRPSGPPLRERLVLLAGYALASVVLVRFYSTATYWHRGDIALFWEHMVDTPWRYRLLMPTTARLLASLTGLSIETVYFGLLTAAVFLALVFFRRVLAEFTGSGTAWFPALLLLYPLAWNYCLLNDIYTPFDLPQVALATAGYLCILRRKWVGLYVVIALGLINRESIFILIVAYVLVWYGRLERRPFAVHLAGLLGLFLVLKLVLTFAVPGAEPALFGVALSNNLRTWSNMVLLRGHWLKDCAKLVLAFGALWILVPFLYRGLPGPAKRLVLVAVPYVLLLVFAGILDEMRSYAELVPVLTLPAALAASRARWGRS